MYIQGQDEGENVVNEAENILVLGEEINVIKGASLSLALYEKNKENRKIIGETLQVHGLDVTNIDEAEDVLGGEKSFIVKDRAVVEDESWKALVEMCVTLLIKITAIENNNSLETRKKGLVSH